MTEASYRGYGEMHKLRSKRPPCHFDLCSRRERETEGSEKFQKEISETGGYKNIIEQNETKEWDTHT